MGNDNSSVINFGPFQDADFECIFTGTMQAPVSLPLLPQWFGSHSDAHHHRHGTECLNPNCTKISLVMLSRPDLMAMELIERLLVISVSFGSGFT